MPHARRFMTKKRDYTAYELPVDAMPLEEQIVRVNGYTDEKPNLRAGRVLYIGPVNLQHQIRMLRIVDECYIERDYLTE